METETEYLVSYEDPRREGGIVEGARDVARSFLSIYLPPPYWMLQTNHISYINVEMTLEQWFHN